MGSSVNAPGYGPGAGGSYYGTRRTPDPFKPGMGGPTQQQQGFGSGSFDPTYMTGAGGTYSASRNKSAGAGGKTGGILSTPGEGEQWWSANKGRMGAPTASNQYYAGLQGRTGGAGLQPTNTSDAYRASQAYFGSPTMAENWAGQSLGQLGEKGYAEQLYEAGGDHLNPFYDRARDKGMKDLERRMASSGMFGSGATARGMYELEGELGAAQARDMAGLAAQADQAKMQRFGEGRATAQAGTGAERQRYGDWFDAGNALDTGQRASEQFNMTAAGQADSQQLARDQAGFDMARDAQNLFQNRERLPINDKMAVADKYAGLFTAMRNADLETQMAIRENIIQSYAAEAGIDYAEAEQAVEQAMQGASVVLKAKTPTTASAPRPTGSGAVDINGPYSHY